MNHLLDRIAELSHREDLPVLLIGGHAVTSLGCPRSTFDIDLLIPRSAQAGWQKALTALKYQIFHQSDNFLQFESSPDLPLPPIDFMLVDEEVFEQLSQSQVRSTPLSTPSVIQLIALKLHALRQPSRNENNKDWGDILGLIDAHSLTLDNSELNAIVLKHGGEEAITRISNHLGQP